MLTPATLHQVCDSLDGRARAIMRANVGQLAPSTQAWKEILQLAYLATYLRARVETFTRN